MRQRARASDSVREAGPAHALPDHDPGGQPSSPTQVPGDHPGRVRRALGNDTIGRLLATTHVQAKLRVSQVDDASEREADRVAALVLGMEVPKNGELTPPRIIRRFAVRPTSPTHDQGLNRLDGAAEMEQALRSLQCGGQPLPTAVREFYERRFGTDLSEVRIHTDRRAADAARTLGARAFAWGSHIAFDRGEYAPESRSGRHLLAHEIAHTRQHQLPGSSTPASSRVVQRKKSAPEPNEETHPKAPEKRLYDYVADRDIQWHVDPIETMKSHSAAQLHLLISVQRIASRGPVSAPKIAAAAVDILVANTGLQLKEGMYGPFVRRIAAQLNTRGFEQLEYAFAALSDTETGRFFEHESYSRLKREARANSSGREIQTRLTEGDYIDFEGLRAEEEERARRLEAWAESKEKTIRRLITKARNQKPRPLDLPDKVSARKGRKHWFLRVWVNYDRRKKTRNRATGLVRLRTTESDAALFARVRAATERAMILDDYAEKTKREKEFPPWAKAKKKAIEAELLKQRQEPGNRNKKNFPDGMVLVAEEQTQGPKPKPDPNDETDASQPGHVLYQRIDKHVESANPGTAKPLPQSKAAVGLPPGVGVRAPAFIYLHVWVERGSGKSYQRKGGTVPVPLTQQTSVVEIAGYIRKLTAVLRQYEEPPLDKPTPPSDSPKKLSEEVTLRAFPALLKPKDLSPSQISVSGAKNEFSMQLDYQDVYERHRRRGTDLFVASKLYSQRIHFFWKVFSITSAVRDKVAGALPTEWPRRWVTLYDTLNATGQPYPEARWKNEALFAGAKAVDEGDSRSSSRRVQFPPMKENDSDRDYIVFCHTGHKPIKSAGESLQRVASVAYYPVRIRPIKKVAGESVTRRSRKMAQVEREISQFEAQLENEELSELHRDVLEKMLELSKEHQKRLHMLESGSPGAGIRAELEFIRETLPKLDLIDAARSKARLQHKAPSKYMEDRPDLLAIHFYLMSQKKFVYEYRQELEDKRKQFRKNAKVAHTFRKDVKRGSPFQFTAEAAMVSTLTGRVYPLTLMIGEAPDRKKRAYRRQKRAEARMGARTAPRPRPRRGRHRLHGHRHHLTPDPGQAPRLRHPWRLQGTSQRDSGCAQQLWRRGDIRRRPDRRAHTEGRYLAGRQTRGDRGNRARKGPR